MAKKKRPPNEVYQGECVTSMDRPNQLVALEACDEFPSRFFPLLKIQVDEDVSRGDERAVFFDEMHGEGWWQWNDRAPTWMDPHKFVEMSKEHKRLMSCLEFCFKKNSAKPAQRDMPAMLDEVMEWYLEYMLDKFEVAKPYLIEWLVRNYCSQETDPASERQKKAQRKKKRATRKAKNE